MADALTYIGVSLLLACGSAAALGPTQPFAPPQLAAPAPVQAASAAPLAGLTGVRFGTTPAALIDGDWVRPGQAVRGARLVSVNTGEAVLKHPDGRVERLLLASANARFTAHITARPADEPTDASPQRHSPVALTRPRP